MKINRLFFTQAFVGQQIDLKIYSLVAGSHTNGQTINSNVLIQHGLEYGLGAFLALYNWYGHPVPSYRADRSWCQVRTVLC